MVQLENWNKILLTGFDDDIFFLLNNKEQYVFKLIEILLNEYIITVNNLIGNYVVACLNHELK